MEKIDGQRPDSAVTAARRPQVENPKARVGASKPSVFALPPIAEFLIGQVMAGDPERGGGSAEYGLFNWREAGVFISTYYDAIRRHLAAYRDGQDLDPKSGLPHLAHIAASCMILLDAQSMGMLTDDRGPPGAVAEWLAKNTKKPAPP